ncbi:MAG: MarR family transcriptional regulator [Bacillota bacterium]|nr:MarR family transcriptional regulator [Bacillota bacterium]
MEVSRALAKLTQQNAKSLGLSLQQLGVINTIYSKPSITIKEITQRLFLSKSTASMNVDALVKLGLVERNVSKEDRREVNLTLTDEGAELSRKSSQNPASYKAMINAIEKISQEDIGKLLQLHGELLSNLNSFQ